jgi:ATP-dependent RNA circularization protein (DNA/RNA ligase family)
MAYGFSGKSFRAFDIAVNNKYLSYDVKKELLEKFGVEMVPILYRGPFNKETLELHTSGPTTMCETKAAGKFAGREGIVCTPTVEVPYCRVLNGRRIVKSVSADYLARKGGTEFH